MKKIIVVIFTTLALIATLGATGVQSGVVSSAAPAKVEVPETKKLSASVYPEARWILKKKKWHRNKPCKKKRRMKNRPGKCKAVFTVHKRKPYWKEIRRSRTSRSFPVKCFAWKTTDRGFGYVSWGITTRASWCVNKRRTKIYQFRRSCNDTYGTGFSVDNVSCKKVKRFGVDSKAGWMYSVYNRFKVSFGMPWGSVTTTHQHHVNAHPSGYFSAWRDW